MVEYTEAKNIKREIEENAKEERDVDEKVKKFMNEFHVHGMGCGQKIAEIVRFIHPNALLIVPLYRSCIVIEQSEQEKTDGDCTVHAYADPHWQGGEIDLETLKSNDFHFIYEVHGDRQGPAIIKIAKVVSV